MQETEQIERINSLYQLIKIALGFSFSTQLFNQFNHFPVSNLTVWETCLGLIFKDARLCKKLDLHQSCCSPLCQLSRVDLI